MSNSKTYFDKVSSKWDHMRKNFFPDSLRTASISEIEIFAGAKIADLGSGTGFISEGLIQFDVDVFAIDQSMEMLNRMKQKFSGEQKLHYLHADAENIPLKDNYLDYALANMYLHHVERPYESIREIARILKPSGKLVITDLDKHNHEFLAIEQFDRWLGFDREDIKDWFARAGFTDIKIECVNANCCANSSDSDDFAEISIFLASGVKI